MWFIYSKVKFNLSASWFFLLIRTTLSVYISCLINSLDQPKLDHQIVLLPPSYLVFFTTINDGIQAPSNVQEISWLALTSRNFDKTKNSKMTANDHDSCSITLLFAWMGATWILPVCSDCKIAVDCHTMLIKSCEK